MANQTITTTAEGRASAPPDEVDLQFAASAEEPDVERARRAVVKQATELRQVLDATGIPADRVRTSRYQIRQRPPEHGHRSDQDTRPYRATETVSVTLFDLDRLGEILSTAVDETGIEINEVAFTFRTETRRDLQHEAVADAVTTARKKADAAAAAEELTVDEVRSIVTDDGSQPRRTSAGQQLAADSTEAGSVESGPIEVTVRVEVEYGLNDA